MPLTDSRSESDTMGTFAPDPCNYGTPVMSLMRYFMHDYWQTSQIDRLDRHVRSMRLRESASRGQLSDRVDELEDALARTTLALFTLHEACLRKGLLSSDDLNAVMDEIDLRDGVRDGKLNPESLKPPEERRQPPRPSTPGEFLRGLEEDG